MLLITFEGIDGCGKSTQVQLLDAYLHDRSHDTLRVREPGGTALSERVRSLLLNTDLHVEPMAELLLFSAARAQLVAERIRPALDAGRIVLCDRFYDSTTAYQGAGRGVADAGWLRGLHRRVTDGLVPDRTYLIEVDPETARRRRRQSGALDDRMETSDHAFFDRVRHAYERLADEEPDRFVRLDGRDSVDALHTRIRDDIDALLKARDDGGDAGTAFSSNGSPDD